jgi:hypothetical protein
MNVQLLLLKSLLLSHVAYLFPVYSGTLGNLYPILQWLHGFLWHFFCFWLHIISELVQNPLMSAQSIIFKVFLQGTDSYLPYEYQTDVNKPYISLQYFLKGYWKHLKSSRCWSSAHRRVWYHVKRSSLKGHNSSGATKSLRRWGHQGQSIIQFICDNVEVMWQ